MEEPTSVDRRLKFFREVVAAIEAAFARIARTVDGEHNETRKFTSHACVSITASGLRQLKAALVDIENGWAPESVVHVRAAFDATIDIAFLLSHHGRERLRLARQYAAMVLLREPTLGRVVEDEPPWLPDVWRDLHRNLATEYAGSKGLRPNAHWSGVNKGEIPRIAYSTSMRWKAHQDF